MPNYVTSKVQPLSSVDASQQPTEVLYFKGNTTLNSEASAWPTPAQTGVRGVHQIAQAAFFGVTSSSYVGNNTYYNNANWKAMITGAGSVYAQGAGAHSWYTFASVAADATQTVVERMRLNLTGGLSLGGATIAPWFESSSAQSAMQFHQTGSIFGYNTQMAMGNNIYRDASNWRAITTAASCMFRCLAGGSWDWYSGASVSADAVVGTLTQVLNLSASGNLTFGGASPQLASSGGAFIELYNGGTGAMNFSTTTSTYDFVFKVATSEKLRVHNTGVTVTGTGSSIPAEAWIAPTLTNSWVNYGGGYHDAGYYKDPSGRVHLRGLVASGTLATTALTLPTGYRPAGICLLPMITAAGATYCQIGTDGAVHLPAGASATWTSLENISFRV